MYPCKPAIYPFNLSIFFSFMSFVNQFIHQPYAIQWEDKSAKA